MNTLLSLLESMNGATTRKAKRASNICVEPGCGLLRHHSASREQSRCKKHYLAKQKEYYHKQKEKK